jgi:GNAT superfamily N-acetyltransferase
VAEVQVVPATAETWSSLGEVFGPRAANRDSCWCQRFRRHDAPDNRSALQQEIQRSATPVGLIAYHGGAPIGWTRVVPRSTLPGIVENRALRRVLDDDPRAWWVTCFVVRREHRGLGVGVRLLETAAEWATQHRGSVLDGHPVDTARLTGSPSAAALFTGTDSMFRRAGFAEIARTSPSRPVMRRRLS